MNSRQAIGEIGEAAAAEKYRQAGFKILSKNFFNHLGKRTGELDFIAIKNKQIHFVEVKSRTGFSYGSALEGVSRGKLLKLLKIIRYFLARNQIYSEYACHIDVVTVQIREFDKSVQKITIYLDVIVDDYWS